MNYILKQYDNDLLYFSMKNTNNGLEIFIDAVNQNLHDLLPLEMCIRDRVYTKYLIEER